jgi:cellulose synthase operon protein YhjQ
LRWSVLDTLLSGEARNPQHHLVQALAQSVSVPFLLMFSASGGVGKTTIMATLGRMFADDNERVLLAETAALSLLPFSFGAQSPGQSELRSFPTPGSNAEVDILSCLQNNENVSEFAGSVRDSEGGFVSMITKAAGLANRLLLDASNVSADDILALRAKNHLALMPIVPDLNCALDLMRMEEALQDSQIKSGNEAPLYYVLNKFDSSLALHRDIRSYLQQKVGERLLPTILRRSDAIPEALAQGMTVMDYCREAGIVDDFLALRDWLRRMAPRRSSEETQP